MASADQMLNMSLDDIIKLSSKPTSKPDSKGKPSRQSDAGRGGRGGRGGSQAARGGLGGRGDARAPIQQSARNGDLGVRRGGISKPRGSLSSRPRTEGPILRTIPGPAADRKPAPSRRPTVAPRLAQSLPVQQPRQQAQQQFRSAAPPSGNQMWQRDMYRDDDRPARRTAAAPAHKPAGYKLKVRNLDHNVTEEDIKELFGSIGELISHKIRFDRSGRSMGIAEVLYVKKVDAEAAVNQFNGVQLDGKPMQISMDDSIMTLPSGISVTRPGAAGVRTMRSRQEEDYMQE